MSRFSDDLSRDEFYREAVRPDFPDTMQFQLSIPEEMRSPETTFSHDGIDQLVKQIETFISARLLGTWNGSGNPPSELSATLSLKFKAEPIREGFWPWWVMVDEGRNPIDLSYRPEP